MDYQYYHYGMLSFTLIFTAYLLVLTQINHSRNTKRYRILKICLWLLLAGQLFDFIRTQMVWGGVRYPEPVTYVIFVGYYLCATTVMILIALYMLMQFPQIAGRENLLYTIFFVCECTAVMLIMSTNITGFIYFIKGDQLVFGIADQLFFALRIVILIGFLVMVWVLRRKLAPKLYQNWMVMLLLSVVIHMLPLFLKNVHVFEFFANVFLATAFFMFHCGTYEEGSARMGADMYRSELDYQMAKNNDFYIYEIQIRNYEQIVERRVFSEEELDGFYGMFASRVTASRRDVMVFQKKHTSLGVIVPLLRPDEAEELAGKMQTWMSEFFAGKLVFGIAAARCPKYAMQFVDVERLLRLLQKKCPKNSYHFCDEEDYDEYCEREDILRLLHDMHLEKQDVVLFGRPMVESSDSRATCYEILCRLQLAGSGIIRSEHVIRLAEKYGYIHDVNMAVLAKVCDFLMTDLALSENLRVSLHVSSEELENPGFAEDVLAIIKDYELAPEVIEFEVTMVPGESDMERMREVMSVLREHQIMFALTDFEPTSVNFESIMGLPFEMIKFERHWIMRASETAMCYDVMGMLVDLFKGQGFRVAFKGIDNARLEEVALTLGADVLQGEKYKKPFPIDEMEAQADFRSMY